MTKTIAEFAEELQTIRDRFANLNTTELTFEDNLYRFDFFTPDWLSRANVFYNYRLHPEAYTNAWLDKVETAISQGQDWSEEVDERDILSLPYHSGFSEKQVIDLVREAIQINRDFNNLTQGNPLVTMAALTFETVVRISSEYYESSSCW